MLTFPIKAVLFLIFLYQFPSWATDDQQVWTSLWIRAYQEDRFSLHAYGELRMEDNASRSLGYFSGLRGDLKLDHGATLGLAVKAIFLNEQGHFSNIGRYELEWRQVLASRNSWQWRIRNRGEYFDRERLSSFIRFRHGVFAQKKLSAPKNLANFYFSLELFHDDRHLGDISEIRAVPVGFTLDLKKKRRLKLFYMAQARDLTTRWIVNHALGCTFVFSL